MSARRNDGRPPDGFAGNQIKDAVINSSSSDDDKSSSSESDSRGNSRPVLINDGGESTATTKSFYRDYSKVPPERKDASSSILSHATSTKEQTFPVKLHMILSNPDFQDIIGWLPHGRSWRILQQKAFEEKVIPLYFRHGRYSSFARQVNGWGFRRITNGSDYNSYYHEVRTVKTFMVHGPMSSSAERFLFFYLHFGALTISDFLSPRQSHSETSSQCLTFFRPFFFFLFSLEQLFLRGLPHLCDRMRRLTAKDVAKRKTEGDEPTPDFYALNRDCALPESTPVRSISTSATAAATASSHPAPSLADVELAILEKRHAEIMDRINLLSSTQGSRPDSSVLNQASLFGQLAPASLGHQDLSSLQQRFSSSVQSNSVPTVVSATPRTNQFFQLQQLQQQQQQQQQQPNIASLLAALNGKGSVAALVPAPAPAPLPPTHTPSTGSDLGALLQQAGLNALLQQGGGGGQPNLGNLIAQLLQSAGAGGNTQPASAPAPTPSAPVPNLNLPASSASLFAQPFGGFGGNQVSAHAPSVIGSSAPVNNAQLFGHTLNDANSDLQRQLLEARLANTDLSTFLGRNNSGPGG
jgi:hypothetical protein